MKISDNDINKWGLLNSLISLMNEGVDNTTDVTIAKYLLENYNRLQDLNIYDVAEECFVSRATIRRIAKKLGFDNFKDLKSQFHNFSDNYSFYRVGIDENISKNTLVEKLSLMAQECEAYFNEDKIDIIIKEMNEATQIVFLTSDIYSRQSSEFQKAMILSGKLVRVISSKFVNNEILANLKTNDILIVISIAGFFVSQVAPFVKDTCAKKILFTTIEKNENNSIYDEVWCFSKQPKLNNRNVYTMYATQYCLEMISTAYIKKFGI